jgi:hypothetical protein
MGQKLLGTIKNNATKNNKKTNAGGKNWTHIFGLEIQYSAYWTTPFIAAQILFLAAQNRYKIYTSKSKFKHLEWI